MRKRILSVALCVTALGSLTFAACRQSDLPDVYYTVSFVMPDGSVKDVTVKKGDSLRSEQIPAIEIEGYEGAKWSRELFDNITENLRVVVDKSQMKAIEYTVKYDTNGGEALAESKVTYDAEYTLREPVAPDGKYFYYWYNVDDPCLKNDDPADDYKANVALTGVWKIAGENKTVNLKAAYKNDEGIMVTFMQTGQAPQQLKIEKGKKITAEQLASIRIVQDEGYEPYEWDFDFENTPITETIQIALKPAVAKTFTITYELGEVANAKLYDAEKNETKEYTQRAKYGENVVVGYAEAPLNQHKKFLGWKVKGEDGKEFAINQKYEFTKDITLVAQWRNMTDKEISEAEDADEKNWTGFY